MGNPTSKSAAVQSSFDAEDRLLITHRFSQICGCNESEIKSSSPCSLESFLNFSSQFLPVELCRHIFELMKQSHPQEADVDLESFVYVASKLLKGNVEELTACLILLASTKPKLLAERKEITSDLLRLYCEEIIRSCLKICKKEFNGWNFNVTEENISLLCLSSLQELIHPGLAAKDLFDLKFRSMTCDPIVIEKWLLHSPLFINIQRFVFRKFFGLNTPAFFLPLCNSPVEMKHSILDVSQILFLNNHLPMELQKKWALLFSTKCHGENFSALTGKILNVGPTIILVKSEDGRVFGGFASTSWAFNGHFFGNSSCFLFSLKPKMGIYQSTGYNDHYQYINIQQQTLPNGLGFGGQMEYFGLWLDSNFGMGKSSKSCSTFNCPQLSAKDQFRVAHVEAWGLSSEEMAKKGQSRPRVLDSDTEGKALLEIMGKHFASEGLREEDPTAGSPEEKELPPLSLA